MNDNKIHLGNLDMLELIGFKKCKQDKCQNPNVHTLDYCWEHLDENQQNDLKKILIENKKELKHIRLAFVDLSGLDFSDANLSNSFLLNCILDDCDFENASMIKTQLINSSGKNIDFQKAKLNNANLTEVDFTNANFSNSILASAYAYNAKIIKSNFYNTLANAATFRKCNLSYSNFKNSKLVDCNFRESILTDCDFTNSNIEFSQFSLTDLSNSKFINTKIFGMSPWGAETNNTNFTNLIRNFNDKSNLPSFLYPESKNQSNKKYILKFNIYNEYSSVINIIQKLEILNQIFKSEYIWKTIEPPKLMITTIDKGSVEIKMIIDLAQEYLPYVNSSLLTTAIIFAFGIKFVANTTLDISKKYLDICINYKKLKNDEKKYQLEDTVIKDLIEFNKNKSEIIKELRQNNIQLNTKIEIVDTILKNLISNNKNIDLFKGIKFIEVVYPKTSEFKEAYLIRINEQGEINLLDIEHYTHKTEESNKSS